MALRNSLPFMLVIIIPTFLYYQQSSNINALRFSNTQSWDPDLTTIIKSDLYYDIDLEDISLPEYTTNLSSDTEREINTLIEYKSLRTKSIIKAINDELSLYTTEFGVGMAADYFDPNIFPKTSKVLNKAFRDLDVITLSFKKKFDRVRPSFLNNNIDPIIEVPSHPAYPSGHSAQAHFIAYVLSELDPVNRERYFNRASEIAWHREIAGVHYPSDSYAGKLLAEQVFNQLMTKQDFRDLLYDAKSEW